MQSEDYFRVKQVFLEAIEAPAAERQAFLSRACAGDVALRGEVESLLKNHQPGTLLKEQESTTSSTVFDVELQHSPTRTVSYFGPAWQPPPLSWFLLGTAAALVLGMLIRWWFYDAIQRDLLAMERDTLVSLCSAKKFELVNWMSQESAGFAAWARSGEVRDLIDALVDAERSSPSDPGVLHRAPEAALLRQSLTELAGGPLLYAVWNREGTKLTDHLPEGVTVGNGVTDAGAVVLNRVFTGEVVIRLPHNRESITRGYLPETDEPVMAVVTPVRNRQGKIIAALLLRGVGTEARFQTVLGGIDAPHQGRCYAFSRDGLIVSETGDSASLRTGRLIADAQPARTALQVRAADPGGNLLQGYRASEPPEAWPLTHAARMALSGQSGVSLAGYRDFLGRKVIGAWEWLDDQDMGLVVERDFDQVMQPIQRLNEIFLAGLWLLFAILAVTLGVAGWYWWTAINQRQMSRQVGPYVLEDVLGEGGMGTVYRARHELLKRPTAIKFLKNEHPELVFRFEREVQIVSRLEHPNTIEIYDYGRTPEGQFFYAMELINGIDLHELVRIHGPMPVSRAVFVTREICLSLREAHLRRLVHRDIKPQNVMLCCRGGEADRVKVLDFGLVKPVTNSPLDGKTRLTQLAGTPRYVAPERLLNPRLSDPAADIYSVGAVLSFLLSGHEIFSSAGLAPLLQEILSEAPKPPSAYVEVPLALDALVQRCLAKDPTQRPGSIIELLHELEQLDVPPWDQMQATIWWATNRPHQTASATVVVAQPGAAAGF